ncbi:GL23359 [Drosophila persimilis]|uniref:GL23359 n=1 Tax=Drosophila persimilis TaxID=7234 RepID=B4G4F9_DROPE|nr:GL23359 [Drosophila persimilis]
MDNPSSPPPNTPSDAAERRGLRASMTSPVGDFEPFENEDEILGDQTVRHEEEEDGEELFGDNMENDYRPMPELDHYDPAMLDDEEDFSEMSQGDRFAAESEMRKRDHAAGIHRDDRELGFGQSDDEDDVGPRAKRRGRRKGRGGRG